MNIVFNTTDPHAPCSLFYTEALSGLSEVKFYDQEIYKYDIALFMTYDYNYIEKFKKAYPSVKIGMIDPRSYRVAEATQHCDFLVVDSVEMEDYWRQSKKPIFRYVEYPNIPYIDKEHKNNDTIKIGYHGNLIHLECMAETATIALSNLGKKYDIEFVVMHNRSQPIGTEKWYPKNVKVTHVPWSMENYVTQLAQCDIGLAPNNMIHNVDQMRLSETNNNFNFSEDDYSIRFKMPSNPGRYVVFGRLGIPTIADFYPSALRYLTDDRGMVAHSACGWEYCIEKLINDIELRKTLSKNLKNFVKKEWDFSVQNKKFLNFLGNL